MPFPSAGCRTCKNRRIKCDEAQPVCQKCMKSQRKCCGMRPGPLVHIENSYASGQQKRPRGPRSMPMVELTYNLGAGLWRPFVDLTTQAMLYYLRNHLHKLEDTPNILKHISDDFLPTWRSISECPVLDLAVSSMALVVFSRTQGYPPAAIEAAAKYHQLLRITQVMISSLDQGNIDACLLAIFFMSRYENIVHCPSHLHSKIPFAMAVQSFSHHDGALAILKIWKDRLSHCKPATDIIKHTRRSMIKSALLRSLAMPEWMLEGAAFGEHGLELGYDRIVVQIANVRERLSTLLKEKTSQQRASHDLLLLAEGLNEEARDIDKALEDWAAHFPSAWSHRRHTLSKWPTRDFYSPTVYSFSSPAYAAVWNHYYSTRMLVNSTRLRVLDLSCTNPDDFQRLECLSRMKAMADDLASSLPFCLQRFEVTQSPKSSSRQDLITLNMNEDLKPYVADLTVWHLSIASSLGDVDVKQKLWFRFQLARCGRMIGDRVLEFEEADQWLQL